MADPAPLDWDDDDTDNDDDFLAGSAPASTPDACDVDDPDCEACQ